MDDLVSRLARELPDTDKDRYDIAYQRGRAQARSTLLFGGLLLGAVAGAVGTFLFDPLRGRGRRVELGQRAGAMVRDLTRTLGGRSRDLRNRAVGAATELGLPGTARSGHDDGGSSASLDAGVGRPVMGTPPRSVGAPLTRSNEDVEDRTPALAGSGH